MFQRLGTKCVQILGIHFGTPMNLNHFNATCAHISKVIIIKAMKYVSPFCTRMNTS
jgi:hypothetical protein